MEIPNPPSQVAGPQILLLPKHTVLHRVHLTNLGAAQFNPGRGGQTRFAPFHDSAGRPVPSRYASASLRAAIHETIFHEIPASAPNRSVRLNEVQIRTHSELRSNHDLQLVELRNVNLGRWGISRNDLISSPPSMYGLTVLWAAAIHRDISDAEGLVWTSNQCDPDSACLFFGDRVHEGSFETIRSRDGMTDHGFLEDVRNEGRLRGITLTI